jgi:hypothetical protein
MNDNSIEFVWNRPDIGSGCYPDTYPKNKQVNNVPYYHLLRLKLDKVY